MHHRAVFANEESMRAIDGEVVSALDAVGAGNVEDREPAIVGGFDALAGAQVLRLYPARAFDVPGMVVGDFEDFRLAVGVTSPLLAERRFVAERARSPQVAALAAKRHPHEQHPRENR